MCQIAKKTKIELKVLLFVVVNIPFVYTAAVVKSGMNGNETTGWWVPILFGIAMAIYFLRGSLWKPLK